MLIRRFNFLIPFCLLLAACQTIPEYPAIPSISYGSAYFQEFPQTDYIFLSVNFKDGDGDLGLDSEDLPSRDSADRFNIFPVLLRKNGDTYDTLREISYAGTFPRLRESSVAGPIEGTLQYKLGSLNFFNEDSSIAKIRIYIRDRAGNTSNIIETPPFPVVYK
jgi:hypothetical protein